MNRGLGQASISPIALDEVVDRRPWPQYYLPRQKHSYVGGVQFAFASALNFRSRAGSARSCCSSSTASTSSGLTVAGAARASQTSVFKGVCRGLIKPFHLCHRFTWLLSPNHHPIAASASTRIAARFAAEDCGQSSIRRCSSEFSAPSWKCLTGGVPRGLLICSGVRS